MTDRYNGWTNYETWNVALWLGNDEGSYHYWNHQAYQCLQDAEGDKQEAALILARYLESEITEMNPLADHQASTYSDMLTAALGRVNWDEIARHWIDDIDEE
jgi:hypothetical protein